MFKVFINFHKALIRSKSALERFDDLGARRNEIILQDQKIKKNHDQAFQEFELLQKEQKDLLNDEKKVKEANDMLNNALKIMEDEKKGVLNVNSDDHNIFSSLQDEHRTLQQERDSIFQRDKELGTYNSLTIMYLQELLILHL